MPGSTQRGQFLGAQLPRFVIEHHGYVVAYRISQLIRLADQFLGFPVIV
jgi:hypothetical protein